MKFQKYQMILAGLLLCSASASWAADGNPEKAEADALAARVRSGQAKQVIQELSSSKKRLTSDMRFPATLEAMKSAIKAKDMDLAAQYYALIKSMKDLKPSFLWQAGMEYVSAMKRDNDLKDKAVDFEKSLLSIPGLSSNEIMVLVKDIGDAYVRENFPHSGFAAYNDDGLDKAIAFYESAMKLPGVDVAGNVEIRRRIADCCLNKMQVDEANKWLKSAVDFSADQPDAGFAAKFNLMTAYVREVNYVAAESLLTELYALAKDDSAKLKALNEWKLRILEERDGSEAAYQFFTTYNTDKRALAAKQLDFGKTAVAEKLLLELLDDVKVPARDRTYAFGEYTMRLVAKGASLDEFKQFVEKYLPEMRKLDNNFVRSWINGTVFKFRSPFASKPELRRYSLSLALAEDPLNEKNYSTFLSDSIALDDFPEVSRMLDVLLKEYGKPENKTKIKAENLFLLELEKTVCDKADGDIEKIVESVRKSEFSSEVKNKSASEAAKFAMKIKHFKTARALWNAFFKPQQQRSLTVPFLTNAPKDISSCLAHPYVKDEKNHAVLDRKYGDNLQFLLDTDANLTGRVVTGQDAGFKHTWFTAFCDEEGLKILLVMPCSQEKLEQIRAGYASMGGYEMYLAKGFGTPYDCLMPNCEPGVMRGGMGGFLTQYDNPHFNGLSMKKGNVSFETQLVDGAVVSLLCEDWTSCADSIPVNGTVWEFEPIHWEGGGWSWGGSESVHNRSSFGHLVFANLTPENLTRIKHRLLSSAKRIYSGCTSAKNSGILEVWMDPELGDIAFYKSVIKPFREKYDAVSDSIKADMTPEQINKTFDENYALLKNVAFIVEDIRRGYLNARETGCLEEWLEEFRLQYGIPSK